MQHTLCDGKQRLWVDGVDGVDGLVVEESG